MTATSGPGQTHLTTSSRLKDSAGVLCSSLCLTHCLLLPLLLPTALASGVLGTAGALLASEQTHWVLLVPVVLLAVVSFPAAHKHHGNLLPGILALMGLSSLILALLSGETAEKLLTAIGAGLLIVAHLKNSKLLKTAICND